MTTPVGNINGSRNLGDWEYGKFRADGSDRPAIAVINGDGTPIVPVVGGKVPVDATVTATIDPTGLATDTIQTDGSQKTQIVDAGGEAVTVTGGKLDVNATVTATIDTTGLATDTLQTSGNASLTTIAAKDFATQTTLASIKAKTDNIPALGQALAAASVPVILPADTITTLTPPAAITGFATSAGQLPDGHNVTVDNASLAVTGTFWQATQPVSGTVTANLSATDNAVLDDIAANQTDNSQKTQIVDSLGNAVTVTGNKLDVNATVSTVGLATSAKQDTIIGHIDGVEALLTAIDADTSDIHTNSDTIAAGFASEGSALGSGVLIQGDDGTDRTNVLVDTAGHLQVDVLTMPAGGSGLTDAELRATPVPISGTVTANLSAVDNAVLDQIELNQDAQTALITTIDADTFSIDSKTPALGQALAAASVPVILPAATITTLTPPAAITGFATQATLAKTVGLGLTEWDSVTPTFNATDDAWVFKLGVNTIHTVTINYTSATKKVISSVVRT